MSLRMMDRRAQRWCLLHARAETCRAVFDFPVINPSLRDVLARCTVMADRLLRSAFWLSWGAPPVHALGRLTQHVPGPHRRYDHDSLLHHRPKWHALPVTILEQLAINTSAPAGRPETRFITIDIPQKSHI